MSAPVPLEDNAPPPGVESPPAGYAGRPRDSQLEYKADADTQLLQLKQKMGLIGAPKSQTSKQIGAGTGEVAEAELVDDDEAKPGA